MAAYVKTTWVNGATALSADNMNKIENELVALDTGKVDKVTGKDLSTNDFTNEYKTKIDGIAAGAEVNQNAYSNVKVGSTTIAAGSKADTFELAAGSNVTLTADATNDKVTIASDYSNATTSAAGLMSAADKTKLDGIFSLIYPVGSIYMSVNNTDPSTLFGGTWEAWGSGRVPVGVDTTQTEFATVEKTGGEKTHTLTVNEMPNHYHDQEIWAQGVLSGIKQGTGSTLDDIAHGRHMTLETGSTGGGQAHNVLQPYITCYMWKRTA